MKFYTDELLVTCAPADHLICCWNVNRLALMKTMPGNLTTKELLGQCTLVAKQYILFFVILSGARRHIP